MYNQFKLLSLNTMHFQHTANVQTPDLYSSLSGQPINAQIHEIQTSLPIMPINNYYFANSTKFPSGRVHPATVMEYDTASNSIPSLGGGD